MRSRHDLFFIKAAHRMADYGVLVARHSEQVCHCAGLRIEWLCNENRARDT